MSQSQQQFPGLVEHLARKDVARLAGVSTDTIKRDVKRGLLQEIAPNARRRRYHPEAVEAYLAAKHPADTYKGRRALAEVKSGRNLKGKRSGPQEGSVEAAAHASEFLEDSHDMALETFNSPDNRTMDKVSGKISKNLSVNVIRGEIMTVPSVECMNYGHEIAEGSWMTYSPQRQRLTHKSLDSNQLSQSSRCLSQCDRMLLDAGRCKSLVNNLGKI